MIKPGKILVTGAAGFIGVALCRELKRKNLPLKAVVRQGGSSLPLDLQTDLEDIITVPGDVDADTWTDLLTGVETVVHLAARAHKNGSYGHIKDEFFSDNLDLSRSLASGAVSAGVRRFLFLSTIKVCGEGSLAGTHKVSEKVSPRGAYAVSKWRAEQELRHLCSSRNSPVLQIIRTPLVYGPGVKGNFASLLGWIERGRPLLLPLQENRRSFIYLNNLVDFIMFLLAHPEIESSVMMPADREDYSTEFMASIMSRQMGRPLRSYRLPLDCLRLGAWLLHRPEMVVKMFGSLQVDRKRVEALGWQAPYQTSEGLAETVSWWQQ
ncbi:MAG: NAD-dependent epimerase/dehydratase family protein [Deltaproteobacteria bacterium]|nr:NAD-dependent epimerase/dehydratase family protein [Candidatus Tharpella sp.]